MTDQTPDDEAPAVYPSAGDVPDEPLTASDIDPFSVDTATVDDISELATAEWKASTTAEERIRAVIGRTTSPKSAREIAATAAVSETKARTTLNRLAEEGTVRTHRSDSATQYERDPDWQLLRQVHRLATSGDLVEQIQRVKRELARYEAEFGVDEPEEVLLSDRELTDSDLEAISHWRTARRDFEYLRVAYRLQQARTRLVQDTHDTDGPSPGQRPTQ